MEKSYVSGRQHGLTLFQWGILFVAFIIGLGSSFAIREFFPPAHAGVIQTTSSSSASVK
jgi:hypothetical protein